MVCARSMYREYLDHGANVRVIRDIPRPLIHVVNHVFRREIGVGVVDIYQRFDTSVASELDVVVLLQPLDRLRRLVRLHSEASQPSRADTGSVKSSASTP